MKLDPDEARARAMLANTPPDLPRGRMLLELLRAAGGDAWFSSPESLEFDVPHSLPEAMRGLFKLHCFLNGRAIAKILEEEGSAP
jgi:hypothetical protein